VAESEEEARRTFRRHIAGRRIVDIPEPAGPPLAAVGTGLVVDITPPASGVTADLREAKRLVELRTPFRQDVAIGCTTHDARVIALHLQETLTFLTYTDEAVAVLDAS
jgi:uncharacterized linocin/CFP29 family protein